VSRRFWVIALLMAGPLAMLVGRSHSYLIKTDARGTRRVLYYVDPMHPSYKSAQPGIAPDCGMELQPVYADQVSRPVLASARRSSPQAVTIDPSAQQLFGIRVDRGADLGNSHLANSWARRCG